MNERSDWEMNNKRKPQKEIFFTVYPPDEEFNYYHYKCGLKAWGDFEPVSKIAFFTSLISLVASVITMIYAK